MITVYFKNVGQGDSILLEWEKEGKKHTGIIDCNIINGNNLTLQHLISNKISEIDFIVLSHFHFDHFSGMADIFDYCISNNIKVKCFYHSLAPFLSEILNRIITSQKLQKGIEKFLSTYDMFDKYVGDSVPVSNHIREIKLNDDIALSFLAPEGRLYNTMAKQLARKVNRITTSSADINKLSTVIKIYNNKYAILLTSDAVKKSFVTLRNSISHEVVLAQVPHHGSFRNIDEKFWDSVIKTKKCPAVFSVGDEPKDKLPNKETVAFFDIRGYDVHSTSSVYGINDYFGFSTSTQNPRSTILNTFSKLRATTQPNQPSSKYNRSHKFDLL